jgi:hypothetical protein
LRLFCVCAVLCAGSGFATGLIPRQTSSTDCIELRGFSPPANYTNRATAACRRS